MTIPLWLTIETVSLWMEFALLITGLFVVKEYYSGRKSRELEASLRQQELLEKFREIILSFGEAYEGTNRNPVTDFSVELKDYRAMEALNTLTPETKQKLDLAITFFSENHNVRDKVIILMADLEAFSLPLTKHADLLQDIKNSIALTFTQIVESSAWLYIKNRASDYDKHYELTLKLYEELKPIARTIKQREESIKNEMDQMVSKPNKN